MAAGITATSARRSGRTMKFRPTWLWRLAGLAVFTCMGSAAAAAKPCVTDSELEAVVGDQLRSGVFAVSTTVLGDRHMCSGLPVAAAIQRLRATYFPSIPDGAPAESRSEPRRALGATSNSAAIDEFLIGHWESTVIGVERDPGRCVSTPEAYDGSITSFLPGGWYKYEHQEGDSTGTWRAIDGGVWIESPGSKGAWKIRKLSPDHIILSTSDPSVSSERLRRCHWSETPGSDERAGAQTSSIEQYSERPVPSSAVGGARTGMRYSEVRKRVLAAGYRPVARPRDQFCGYAETCDLPETDACAPAGTGQCSYNFSKGARRIEILGSGYVEGDPQGQTVYSILYTN